jgi:hypothetical protein
MMGGHTAHRRGWQGFTAGMLIAGLTALSLLLPVQAYSDGLEILSRFSNGGEEMQVAVYTEGDETVGLVGIRGTDGKHVSITFNKQEMITFIALVQKAKAIQSDNWVEAGSFSESQTSSPSHIVVYGGPSLQFALTDPSIGGYNFTLATGDTAGFADALNQAEGREKP